MHGTDPPLCDGHGGVDKSTTPEKIKHARQRRRCTAMRSDGVTPCKAYAIRGSNVCMKHGGATPQVKKKAKERLLELVEPALVELGRILRNKNTGDSDKLKAIQMVLDRTGYNGKVALELEEPKWMRDVILAGILVDAPDDDSHTLDNAGHAVIDAEVVDEASTGHEADASRPPSPAADDPGVVDRAPVADDPDCPPDESAAGSSEHEAEYERIARELETSGEAEAWEATPDATVTPIYSSPHPGWTKRDRPPEGLASSLAR